MAKAAAAAAAAHATPNKRIKVKATQTGFYDNERKRAGNVFVIDERAFSEVWMERVSPATPELITNGADELRKLHEPQPDDNLTTVI